MGLGVVIQAGGAGRRLRAVTGDAPKALAPFLEATLIDWQLDRAAALSPAALVVIAHCGAEAVTATVGDRAQVIVEAAPLGTAGGLALLPEGPAAWLVLNVDHVSDVDLLALIKAREGAGVAALSEVAVRVDEGVVDVDGGRLTGWRERPVLRMPVTTGLYVFEAAALRAALTGQRMDMPALVEALMPQGVSAYRHPGTWIDAGTPERLAAAEAFARQPL